MFFSVIIPTHRRVSFLGRLLKSIEKQSFKDFEVVVVDDGSPAETYDSLIQEFSQKLTLRYHRIPSPKGAPQARNLGFSLAQSNWIAFVDDDDEWLPTKLERQAKLILESKDKNLGLIYSWVEIWKNNQKKEICRPSWKGTPISQLLRENFIPSPTVVVSRAALEKTDGFRAGLLSCQDWDLWLRILDQNFSFDYVPSVEAIYHQHGAMSIGKQKTALHGFHQFYWQNRKIYRRFGKSFYWGKSLLHIQKLKIQSYLKGKSDPH